MSEEGPEGAPPLTVDAAVEDDRWLELWGDPEEAAVRPCSAALQAADHEGPARISLLFACAKTLHALNRQWMGEDRPTDVLAFPAPAGMRPFLGDVALSVDAVASQAQAEGVAPAERASHLLVHAVLHLLGYDHAEASEAAAMRAIERAAMAALGYQDPYAGTAGFASRDGEPVNV